MPTFLGGIFFKRDFPSKVCWDRGTSYYPLDTYPSLVAEGGFVHVTWPPPRSKTCQADEIAYCRCRLRSGGGGPVCWYRSWMFGYSPKISLVPKMEES